MTKAHADVWHQILEDARANAGALKFDASDLDLIQELYDLDEPAATARLRQHYDRQAWILSEAHRIMHHKPVEECPCELASTCRKTRTRAQEMK